MTGRETYMATPEVHCERRMATLLKWNYQLWWFIYILMIIKPDFVMPQFGKSPPPKKILILPQTRTSYLLICVAAYLVHFPMSTTKLELNTGPAFHCFVCWTYEPANHDLPPVPKLWSAGRKPQWRAFWMGPPQHTVTHAIHFFVCLRFFYFKLFFTASTLALNTPLERSL